MRSVFLCHASEDKSTVEPVQLALSNAGFKVFYDERSLPPGGDYDARIRAAIAHCDLFVFMASPASIASGKYTLTELRFARNRWPSPVGRVLPVIITELSAQDLPQYLKATTVLKVTGNLAAETRAEVELMLRPYNRRQTILLAVALAICAIVTWLFVLPSRSPIAALRSTTAAAEEKQPSGTVPNADLKSPRQSEPPRGVDVRQAQGVPPPRSVARSNIASGEQSKGPSQPPLASTIMDPSLDEIDRFVRQNFPDGTRFSPLGLGRIDRKTNDHYTQIVRIGTLDSEGVARSEDAQITFKRDGNHWEAQTFEIIK